VPVPTAHKHPARLHIARAHPDLSGAILPRANLVPPSVYKRACCQRCAYQALQQEYHDALVVSINDYDTARRQVSVIGRLTSTIFSCALAEVRRPLSLTAMICHAGVDGGY
jgi:hypothetical protein